MEAGIYEPMRLVIEVEENRLHVPFMRLAGEENQGDQPVECLIYEYKTINEKIHRVMAVMHRAHFEDGMTAKYYRWLRLSQQASAVIDEQGDLLLPQAFAEAFEGEKKVVVLKYSNRIDVWPQYDWTTHGRALDPWASNAVRFFASDGVDQSFGEPPEERDDAEQEEAFDAVLEETDGDEFESVYDNLFDIPHTRRIARRNHRAQRLKKRLAIGLAAAALTVCAALCAWLFSTHVLVKPYDQETADYAVFTMGESGKTLDQMAECLLVYVELASELERGLPTRERAHLVGEMKGGSDSVKARCGRALAVLAQMERSGSILRSTKQSVDLRGAAALLHNIETGAALMNDYAQMAADLMNDAGLWAQHGAGMLSCLRELAEGVSDLVLYGQASMYRQFLTEEELFEELHSGKVFTLMMSSSADMNFENYKASLRGLARTEAALEAYGALLAPAPKDMRQDAP